MHTHTRKYIYLVDSKHASYSLQIFCLTELGSQITVKHASVEAAI